MNQQLHKNVFRLHHEGEITLGQNFCPTSVVCFNSVFFTFLGSWCYRVRIVSVLQQTRQLFLSILASNIHPRQTEHIEPQSQ